jgi:uncharacterized protein involved in exopolysaccharide biosynthesis
MTWVWNNLVEILSVAVVFVLCVLAWQMSQPISPAARTALTVQMRDSQARLRESEERLDAAKLRLQKAWNNVGNFTRPTP